MFIFCYAWTKKNLIIICNVMWTLLLWCNVFWVWWGVPCDSQQKLLWVLWGQNYFSYMASLTQSDTAKYIYKGCICYIAPVTNSGCLMGRGKNSKKGTARAKKLLGTLPPFVQETLEGASSCFVYHRAIQEGTIAVLFFWFFFTFFNTIHYS